LKKAKSCHGVAEKPVNKGGRKKGSTNKAKLEYRQQKQDAMAEIATLYLEEQPMQKPSRQRWHLDILITWRTR
jgi:hypothetical protein